MSLNFTKKEWKPVESGICVVIGAGPGMGRAVAVRFARAGFKLALLNRNEASVAEALTAIKDLGGTAEFFACDITQADQVQEVAKQVKEKLGDNGKCTIEVLVCNQSAGYVKGSILEVDPSVVERSFQVHALGSLHAFQAFVPDMISKNRGTVLVTSATAAFRGSAGGGAFASAMFALRGLTQSLAKTHAKDGIHVAHVRLDCVLNTTAGKYGMEEENAGRTDEIAETYLSLHRQHPLAWTNELDMRPYSETWTF